MSSLPPPILERSNLLEDAESDGEEQVERTSADYDHRITNAVRSIVCISRAFEKSCREIGISLPQYRLLLFLRHGPERAGELAAKVAIKRPTLTALVAGLQKGGHLRRVADEQDGRGVRVALTPKGRAALVSVEAELGDMIDRLSRAGDRDHILDAFDQVASIVDDEINRRLDTGPGTIRRAGGAQDPTREREG